ncbi:FAD dependent oxidoreductase [Coniochaeta ligniaria NRRL 30616]|uniref:FAD dependent oxidoreductase n=1 Tax=Coniochaeta ligniaria NRRL 30616 TaxID=1408157 RepID=A0A1J7JQQ9_9PEZI|nr:FAD dependent oxidoreductase [Coniochaeta ligniaria NRRL 30616]
MASPDPQQKRHIVIIGGGIIGCATAYYLTRHPSFDPALHTITVLEATAIAAGASGKAGGLLALWAYPSCLVPLSYRLHAELAAEHNGAERWGYRKLGCGSISAVVRPEDLKRQQLPRAAGTTIPERTYVPFADALPPQPVPPPQDDKQWEKLPKQSPLSPPSHTPSPLPPDLTWIAPHLVTSYSEMGLGRTPNPETAQVHPYHFTTSLAALAESRGAVFRLGAKVTAINHSKTSVGSVEYEDRATGGEKVLDGITDVVVTAGPWTGRLLPKSKVEGLRAHSVVYEADVSPYAVFTDIALPGDYVPEHRKARGQRRRHRGNVDPEIYARPGGQVYACGEPDTNLPLPETADQVQTDEAQCDDLAAYIATVSPVLAAAPIKTKQACYLPRHVRFGEERGPLIGRTATPGLWVAAGHTCWGIQNGPATGCLMAEMLMEGEARSADVGGLDPRKFKV